MHWVNVPYAQTTCNVQIPASLALEPAGLATDKTLDMAAGAVIPETSIIVLNGAGHCLVKAVLAGEKHALSVTQCLWKLSADAGVHVVFQLQG